MISVQCMYCHDLIRTIGEPEGIAGGVSHAICEKCLPGVIGEYGVSMEKFLDELEAPILVVGSEGRALAANVAARTMLGKSVLEIVGRLGGNVIGCARAELPGGCGKTIHCESCTIRNTVMHTMQTGEPCPNVEAYAEVGLLTKSQRVCFRISTEKRNDVVLLRIDEVDGAPTTGTE